MRCKHSWCVIRESDCDSLLTASFLRHTPAASTCKEAASTPMCTHMCGGKPSTIGMTWAGYRSDAQLRKSTTKMKEVLYESGLLANFISRLAVKPSEEDDSRPTHADLLQRGLDTLCCLPASFKHIMAHAAAVSHMLYCTYQETWVISACQCLSAATPVDGAESCNMWLVNGFSE